MTPPSSPQHWANDFTRILNAAYGSNPNRFPVDVSEVAQEISRIKFPEDPITHVHGERLPGFDGALFPTKKGWGIIYNNSIVSKGRINFTLAHELGHYLLHRKDYPEGLKCNSEDMMRLDSEYRKIEQHANIFAANILMPLDDFRKQINAKEKPTFDEIGGCAERYQTSLLATALRWLEYTERRSVIVVSRDGYILWSRASASAFKTGLYFKTFGKHPIPIPDASLSAKMATAPLSHKNEITRHNAEVWFSEPCDEITLTSDRYDVAISLLHFDDAPTYMEDENRRNTKMWVASLKNEELKKIKAQIEEGKKIQHIAFRWGVTEEEYDALITRIIEEIGASEILLKLQKNIRELLNYTEAEGEAEITSYNIYSEREKVKQEPIPYQYDEIPRKLHQQILYVIEDITSFPSVWNIYCRETGMPSQVNNSTSAKFIFQRIMSKNDIKTTFDIIEIAFQFAEKQGVSQNNLKTKTNELNNYFRKASFGYQLTENRIVRIDSSDKDTQQKTKQEQILKPEDYDDKGESTHNSNLKAIHKAIKTQLDTIQNATPLAESFEWNSSNQRIRLIPAPVSNTSLWKNCLERLHDGILDIKNNDKLSNSHAELIPVIEKLESRLKKYKNSPQRIHDEIDITLSSVKWLEDKREIADDLHTQSLKKILMDCALDIMGDVPKVQEAVEKRKKLRLTQLSNDEQDLLISITKDVTSYIEDERIKQDMEQDVEAFKENQNTVVSQEKPFKIYRWISRFSRIIFLVIKHVSDFMRNANDIIEVGKSILKVLGLWF